MKIDILLKTVKKTEPLNGHCHAILVKIQNTERHLQFCCQWPSKCSEAILLFTAKKILEK